MCNNYPRTRRECIERGETWYFTGKPCKHGHITVRHRLGSCYGCTSEGAVKWQSENWERHLERANRWKENNPDKVKGHRKKTRDKYIEERREYNRKWKKLNPGRNTFLERRRYARKIESQPKRADDELIELIYEECPEGHVVDHIIPLQGKHVCGFHAENNLQYLPKKINEIKNNSFDSDNIQRFQRY